MILNSPSNGGFAYNNNTEMLRIYKSSGTNYIGNGTNNFILNTGTGAIITKSMHSSPNYSNSYNINYYSYPSPFRSNSGTFNEEF